MNYLENYRKSSPESIQAMFASIAKNYDRANSIFSLGMHKKWNRALVESVGQANTLLDLCAGTGEIAFGFLEKNKHSKALLLDFCPQMLQIAQTKGEKFSNRFSIMEADAQEIPLESESVDAVTISYGIRNVKDPKRCFQEVARVLKPGGSFAILELTRPPSFILRSLHQAYTYTMLPILGMAVAKNIHAYRYLAKSVQAFTSPEKLEKELIECGMKKVKQRHLLFGTAALLNFVKK